MDKKQSEKVAERAQQRVRQAMRTGGSGQAGLLGHPGMEAILGDELEQFGGGRPHLGTRGIPKEPDLD